MKEIKYKISNHLYITICPYIFNIEGNECNDENTLFHKAKVGGFYCRRICNFNAMPLLSLKSKKILCTADEEFESSKTYKLLLTEKKM